MSINLKITTILISSCISMHLRCLVIIMELRKATTYLRILNNSQKSDFQAPSMLPSSSFSFIPSLFSFLQDLAHFSLFLSYGRGFQDKGGYCLVFQDFSCSKMSMLFNAYTIQPIIILQMVILAYNWSFMSWTKSSNIPQNMGSWPAYIGQYCVAWLWPLINHLNPLRLMPNCLLASSKSSTQLSIILRLLTSNLVLNHMVHI